MGTIVSEVPSQAQLLPDNTLEAESSIVSPDNIIHGGATRGSNLFHSFSDFNVETGQSVYFANPVGIENILGRVTGSNVSNIDGLLGVHGTANLFLLNPNGVIFGDNADLDISGSFITSTANSFTFADGNKFSATPATGELLTMSVPLGVQFNNQPQGDIISVGLLETGQNLMLQGQNLYLEGKLLAGNDLSLHATDTLRIRDTATDPFTARTGRSLTLQGDQGIDILALQHLEQTPFISGGNLSLISDGVISADAHFASVGNLQFLNRNGGPGNIVSYYDPIISAIGDVVFGNYTGAALKVEATGSIQGGNIRIFGPDTTLIADGSGSDEDLLASSRAAILRAGVDALSLDTLPQTAEGTNFSAGVVSGQPAGSIVVGSINTSNQFMGDGGPIILEAKGNIITTDTFDDVFGFPTSLGSFASSNSVTAGSGGDIRLSALAGEILTGNIDAISYVGGPGAGGDISILALGDITAEDVSTITVSNDGGVGGNIEITSMSGAVAVEDIFSAANNSPGSAGSGGDVTISASGDILVDGEIFARSDAEDGSSSKGGDIQLSTISGDITVREPIDTNSFAFGGIADRAGNVAISSQSGDILLIGGYYSVIGARSLSQPYGDGASGGNGGNITISSTSGNIDIRQDPRRTNAEQIAGILSGSFGETVDAGSGGDIVIASTSGDITIDASIDTYSSSETRTAGVGGNITISSQSGAITLTQSLSSASQAPDVDDVSFGSNKISIESGSGNIFTSGSIASLTTSNGLTGIAIASQSGDIEINSSLVAQGSDIRIRAPQGSLFGDNAVFATSFGNPDSGSIRIDAGDTISGLELITLASAGQSGIVDIQGFGDLRITDTKVVTGAEVTYILPPSSPMSPPRIITQSIGEEGQSGDTFITSTGNLTLENVEILSDTFNSNSGGDIGIQDAKSVVLRNSQLQTRTNNIGNAGNIFVEDASTAMIDATQLLASTSGSGAGGNVFLEIPTIQFDNNAQIAASTSGSGSGGNIIFDSGSDTLTLSGDGTISVETSGTGQAGRFVDKDNFEAGRFLLQIPFITIDGVELTASTSGIQDGGDIEIQTTDLSFANGGEINASTSGSGNGGSLTVNGNSPLTLRGDGRLTVASLNPMGGRAGDLIVHNTSILALRDGVELSAESASELGGGNVNINVDNHLFLTGGSLINASSSNANAGDGGNVLIRLGDGFLIARLEQNNDIIANAVGGNGGDIGVSALQIFGFTEQSNSTFSLLRSNLTNDISASSEFGLNGVITLSTLDLDPSQGLTELPATLGDRTDQIAAGCDLGNSEKQSEFVVSGRGGLPSSQNNLIGAGGVSVPWVLASDDEPIALMDQTQLPTSATLEEAQGVAIDAEGNTHFVAHRNVLASPEIQAASSDFCQMAHQL